MGRMKNYMLEASTTWEKNPIEPYNVEHLFYNEEQIVVQELPAGKLIEIICEIDKKGVHNLSFSSDSKNKGKEDSQVGKFLKKYTYNKIKIVQEKLFNCDIHVYGFMSKSGFQGTDILVNDNYLDIKLVNEIFVDSGIKTIPIIYEGVFNKFIKRKHKSFLIRSKFEPTGERTIRLKRER